MPLPNLAQTLALSGTCLDLHDLLVLTMDDKKDEELDVPDDVVVDWTDGSCPACQQAFGSQDKDWTDTQHVTCES